MIREIDKISVARNQLDTAIKLLFEDHDSISIATLQHPAWHILKDLFHHRKMQSSRNLMAMDQLAKPENPTLTEQDVWQVLNKDWNFIKHANNDPDAVLSFDDDYLEGVIMFVLNDFGQISDQSHNMNVYQLWFIAKNPDVFKTSSLNEALSVYEISQRLFSDLHLKNQKEQRQLGLSILQKSEVEVERIFSDRKVA